MNVESGKIITFYSFKGGVGRTMALANVAFIAAMNSKRVLVMDWDLEAPGLAYYFRGLLDLQQGRAVKDAKGILNVFWEWAATVRKATKREVEISLKDFSEGSPFNECAVSLVPGDQLPLGAALDYISAGSKCIANEVSYEDALANFSWQDFFEKFAGGAILESLRTWCKKNYDLIFIDSRTGLADVAGICTMQLPDEVLLCFVLNRQNIDGTSRVAHAIRQKRNDQVRIRAIPMRTSREGTSEESDAKARAIFELTRVGGFSTEALQDDFGLAVRATEGVPFYETLALLLPQTPAIEVLSANYRQFASEVIGESMSVPSLDPEWMESARRRLQPRHATVDYIGSLEAADPIRASEELHRLLESALEDALDGGGLEDNYIVALVQAAINLPFDMGANGQEIGVSEAAVDLLRTLYSTEQDKWGSWLVDVIEHHASSNSHRLAFDQQAALLDEADSILASSNTLVSKLRRLDLRRDSARIYQNERLVEAAEQVLKEAWQLSASIKKEYSLVNDQLETIWLIEADLHRIQGEAKLVHKDYTGALESYRAAVKALGRWPENTSRLDVVHLGASLHMRMVSLFVQLGNTESAARNAIRSAEFAGRSRGFIGNSFTVLAEPVIQLEDHRVAVEFSSAALLQEKARSSASIVAYSGRSPRQAEDFIRKSVALLRLLRGSTDARVPALLDVFSDIVRSLLLSLARRRAAVNVRIMENLREVAESFTNELALARTISESERYKWNNLLQALSRNEPKNARGPD